MTLIAPRGKDYPRTVVCFEPDGHEKINTLWKWRLSHVTV